MKAAFFTLFSLAAGAIASPVAVPRDEVVAAADVKVTLANITETVKTYTGAINVTVSNAVSTTTTLTADEKTTLIADVVPQFESISTVLQGAVKTAAASATDFTAGITVTSDIIDAVVGLVSEILFTVLAVIRETGLSHVLLSVLKVIMVSLGSLVQTLTSALGLDGLVSAVESVVDLVLGTVTGLLGGSDILGNVTGLLSLVTSVL